jgi:hypothetical protein
MRSPRLTGRRRSRLWLLRARPSRRSETRRSRLSMRGRGGCGRLLRQPPDLLCIPRLRRVRLDQQQQRPLQAHHNAHLLLLLLLQPQSASPVSHHRPLPLAPPRSRVNRVNSPGLLFLLSASGLQRVLSCLRREDDHGSTAFLSDKMAKPLCLSWTRDRLLSASTIWKLKQ